MPWAPGPGAGFTTGRPWLRTAEDAETRNVAVQASDPVSILSLYRRLIALRGRTPALQLGASWVHPSAVGDVVAYTRETSEQVILVVLNLGREAASWQLAGAPDWTAWRPLLGTARTPDPEERLPGGSMLTLGPDEGLILEGIR